MPHARRRAHWLAARRLASPGFASCAQPADPRRGRSASCAPTRSSTSSIASDARLELIGDRFGLTEGPVWVPDDGDGFLLFSDLISNVIYRWAPGEPIGVYLDRSGYSGTELAKAGFQTRRGRMAVLLIGPNGLSLDARGPPALSRRQRPHRDAARARRRSTHAAPSSPTATTAAASTARTISPCTRTARSISRTASGASRRARESRFGARLQRRVPDPRRRDDPAVQRRRQSGRLAQRHHTVARRALPVHEHGRAKHPALRARRRTARCAIARCSSPAKAATA